jgi:FixJ family two-component response regulator
MNGWEPAHIPWRTLTLLAILAARLPIRSTLDGLDQTLVKRIQPLQNGSTGGLQDFTNENFLYARTCDSVRTGDGTGGERHFTGGEGVAMGSFAMHGAGEWDFTMRHADRSLGGSWDDLISNVSASRIDRQRPAIPAAHHRDQAKVQPDEWMVFVIDSDASDRDSVVSVLRSVGIRAASFGSPSEFLQRPLPATPCCLVLDVRLRGVSGLDFQSRLIREGVAIPIIFLTAYGDIPMSVRAMKAGAADFLTKPCRDQDLLDAVMGALEKDHSRRKRQETLRVLEDRLRTVTGRERQILSLVAAGLLNKQIAAELGVSEFTVKVHRGSLMRKLKARSVADLVRIADLVKADARAVGLFETSLAAIDAR